MNTRTTRRAVAALLAAAALLTLAACAENDATLTDPAESLPAQTNSPRQSDPSSTTGSTTASSMNDEGEGEELALDIQQLARLVPAADEIAAFEEKTFIGLQNLKLKTEQPIPVGTAAFPFLEGFLGGFERTYTSTSYTVDGEGNPVPTTQRYTLRALTFESKDAAKNSALALKTSLGRATANLSANAAGDYSFKAYYEVTSSDLPSISEVAVLRGSVMAWVIIEESRSTDRTDVLLNPALLIADEALKAHPQLAS